MRNYDHKTDKELLDHYYLDGNNDWLGILLPRYTMLLFGVCMKYLKNQEEAKDAVQQIFLKVINELPKYQVIYFKSWLYMVTKNHCLMKLRDKGKHTIELDEKFIPAIQENAEIDILKEKERSLDKILLVLNQLNKEQRVCVTLFYLEGKSYQQVADQTGYTVLQVKSHIQNGKRNLKIQMESSNTNE